MGVLVRDSGTACTQSPAPPCPLAVSVARHATQAAAVAQGAGVGCWVQVRGHWEGPLSYFVPLRSSGTARTQAHNLANRINTAKNTDFILDIWRFYVILEH